MIWTSPPAGSGRMGPVLVQLQQFRNVQVAVPPGRRPTPGARSRTASAADRSDHQQRLPSRDLQATTAPRPPRGKIPCSWARRARAASSSRWGSAAASRPGRRLGPGYVVNAWNLVIATYDGATIRAYINGVRAHPVAMAVPLLSVAGSAACSWGPTPGRQLRAGAWATSTPATSDPALPAADVARLYANPYRLFRPAVDIGWLTKPARGAAAVHRLSPHPLRPGGPRG